MTNTQDRVSTAVRVLMAMRREHQTDLAKVLGCHSSAVSGRLKGRISWSLVDLDKLASHYGMTVAQLVDPALPEPFVVAGGAVRRMATDGYLCRSSRRRRQSCRSTSWTVHAVDAQGAPMIIRG